MNLKESLKQASKSQEMKIMSKKDLMKIVGGYEAFFGSCGRSSSSDKCDGTAVCNCPPPPAVKA